MQQRKNLIDLLLNITRKPALYGVSKVEDIGFIVEGYRRAFEGEKSEEINAFLSSFRSFVNAKFESSYDYDWVRLIRFYSAGDIHSIESFRNILNEFIAENNL